jgi:hypothetical protein
MSQYFNGSSSTINVIKGILMARHELILSKDGAMGSRILMARHELLLSVGEATDVTFGPFHRG